MLKLSDAKALILRSIERNIAIMMRSAPGIGKSSLVREIAIDTDRWLIDIRLAQIEPTELRGIPVPNRETGRFSWHKPEFLPVRGEDGKCPDGPGIMFFDEIEKAPVSVKNAALELILDRKIGDYELPDDCAIVCAGNREEDGAFSGQLGTALANRMTHIEVKPDVEVWAKWARDREIEEDIIAYLLANPSKLFQATGFDAFPSPRSWEMASNLIEGVEKEDMRKLLLTSAVGEGVTAEFTAWSKVYREVDPAAVLKGEIPTFKDKDQSFKYAVTLAVAFYARKKGVKKYMSNIATFLKEISPEMRVIFLQQQTKQAMVEFGKHHDFAEVVTSMMELFEM